jgi:flagellar protein FlgJ
LWIPVIVILSQAALESNWWRSKLAIEAKNLFWIKAWGNWKWPVYKIATTEYKNGKPYKIVAKFRKYNDWDESIKDYWQLLTLPRYQQRLAFIDKSNPKQVFEALKEAWYATDPNYDTKLTNLAYNDILNGIKKVA